MSFIFISYSRKDQAYVDRLVQALTQRNLPVWLDNEINHGQAWNRVIREQLDQCQVFLLVMSPRAEQSPWVRNEMLYAINKRKAIFPLLLEGEHWFDVLGWQGADVTDGKLPETRFFDALRKYFPMPVDTAGSLPVKTVVEEKIPPAPATPVRTAKQPTPATQAVELKSEKGVDYRELQRLLKAKKWREADRETWHRMLEAVGRNKNDWIRSEELRTFPCADLKTIDALWKWHSGGKFGFSVQRDIWQQCGSPISIGQDWDRFCVKVGWQDETASQYLDYSELKANPDFSPTGEFPGSLIWDVCVCV
ncbi:MAG: GUN4 domain-containing protein [Cyanobacteria bacterium P01_C01_bin.120]